MRLAEGIVIDKEKTFGLLKFSSLRREVFLQNEDGTVSIEVKERTYDLKSREKGRMIQVSIPACIPLKEFDYNAEVELINPVADTVANATFRGADVDWYIKADDLILKGKTVTPLSFFNFSSLDCLVYGSCSLSLFMFHIKILFSTTRELDSFHSHFVSKYGFTSLVISLVMVVICAFVYYHYRYNHLKQLMHQQKLAKMILDNQ